MKRSLTVTLAVMFLVATVPALAHHSFTNFWKMDETATITGVVKSLKLVNPHCELVVTVTDERGVATDWFVTSRGTGSSILRAGWTMDTLPVGMEVTVEGSPPRREGSPALVAGKITRPDGSEVWFGGGGGIPQG
jgi:hypothetical protein